MNSAKYVKIRSLKSFSGNDQEPLSVRHLDLELTERCNYSCIHCCINQSENSRHLTKKELSADRIKDILFEAAVLNIQTIRITGGEPLLRPDFKEIYLFARKLGISLLLFTNASLITPELAQLFKSVPADQKIEITCYGMNQRSYEAVTRKSDSYKHFRKGIELLLKNEIPFVVKGAVLPQNINEIDRFDQWAATIPWMTDKPSVSMFFDSRIRRDLPNKNKRIRQLRISPEQGLKILCRSGPGYASNTKLYCRDFMRPQGNRLFTCSAGRTSACIDPYGYLYPCMLVKKPSTGYNIRKGSLRDAFTRFFPTIRNIKASDPAYLERCARCFLKGLCEMCPGKSWTEHGNLDTPVEYCCRVAHEQAAYLGYIGKGERAWMINDWKSRIESVTADK